MHRPLPAEGSGTVVTGVVTFTGTTADSEVVENESRKSGYCTFDTIGAAPVPRRSTTMEPAAKAAGADDGDGTTEDDSVAVPVGVGSGVVDGDGVAEDAVLGVELGVDAAVTDAAGDADADDVMDADS